MKIVYVKKIQNKQVLEEKNASDDIIVERKCFCQRKSLYLYWLKAYDVVCV